MAWLDDIVRSSVEAAMDVLETTATLVRVTAGDIDPFAEADSAAISVSYTFKASPALAFKNHEVDGELILQGDMKILLSPVGRIPANGTVIPTPELDHLVQGGVRYRVLAVEIVSGGTLDGLYKLQLRKN